MAAKNFYDAVLVGLDLSTLVAGALLAKRGFRVLVLGDGEPWPSYQVAGFTLPRAPFRFGRPTSPAIMRVFSELALRPLAQRRLVPLEPAFQVISTRHRIDLQRDLERTLSELGRELPAAVRPYQELAARLDESDRAFDALTARDVPWSPSGFFEQRAFARALRESNLQGERPRGSLRPELAPHPLLHQLRAACAMAEQLEGSPDELGPRALRLLGAMLALHAWEEDGLAGLSSLLLDFIREHNGSVQLDSRVELLEVGRRALERLRVGPTGEEVAFHHLLWGRPVSGLRRLLPDPRALSPMFTLVGEPTPARARYVLNLVLRTAGVPLGLARHALLLGETPLWLELRRSHDPQFTVMSVECSLALDPRGEPLEPLATRREAVLASLAPLLPFLAEHLALIDSPHDGRAPERVRASEPVQLDTHIPRGPDTMEVLYTHARPPDHDLTRLPVRTPLGRLLLCNSQVVTGLASEGRFLAGWSAARVVTRALRRDWMNRGRWTKVRL